MKPNRAPAWLCVLLIFSVLAAIAPPVRTASADTPPIFAAANLDEERNRGEKLVQSLGVAEMLGPLAPVALSPFFALTVLSGASLLADSDVAPEFLRNNSFLANNGVLNNGFVFTGLLLLTLVTAAPKLTKVTKPFGQAVDQIEAHAGIISIVLVQFLSTINLGGGGEADQTAMMVVHAGFFSATAATMTTVLVAAFSAINIFVVNTVKFFFEVMTFLSPFPVVDAAFEAANKAVAGFLLTVYLWSPKVATVLNLIIFTICLFIFIWVHRRVVYLKSIMGDPLLGWFGERVFKRPPATPTSTPLPPSIARRFPERTLALKAFSNRSYRGLSCKTRGFLLQHEGRLHFATTRLFREPLVAPLPHDGHRVRIEKGWLSNTLICANDAGETAMAVLFTRRYNDILPAIAQIVGSETDVAASQGRGVLAASRAAGAAFKSGERDALRAELA